LLKKKNLVQVHYVQWPEQYDEWINKDSYRIAPLHTVTKARTNQLQTSSSQTQQINNTQSSSNSQQSSQSMSNRRRTNSNRNASIRTKCRYTTSNKDDKRHNNDYHNTYSRSVDVADDSPPDDNNKCEVVDEVHNSNNNQKINAIQKGLKTINTIINSCNNLTEEEKRKLKNAKIRLNYISSSHATQRDEEYFRTLMNKIGLVIVDM